MLNIPGLFSGRNRQIRQLHGQLVTRAREPVFYAALAVPDTVDGRFDLIVLHAFLLLERLKLAGATALAQGLTDTLFLGLDEGLRELGSGDMGMGRKMKSMANAFYGRMKAYSDAADEAALALAIFRNIYREQSGREKSAVILAAYAMRARASLATTDITGGAVEFGPLPQGQA